MIVDDMSISKLERPAVLEKADGSRVPIMAEIQSKIAFISDINTPIEVDDIIERMRGNIADRFIVTDILLCDEEDDLIEPHIQAKIISEKQTSRLQNPNTQIGSISANRVYINSTDKSSNIEINKSETDTKFEELKQLVSMLSENNETLITLVDEMRDTAGTKSFVTKYNEFISNVANHLTVFQGIAPFMGWLGSFLA